MPVGSSSTIFSLKGKESCFGLDTAILLGLTVVCTSVGPKLDKSPSSIRPLSPLDISSDWLNVGPKHIGWDRQKTARELVIPPRNPPRLNRLSMDDLSIETLEYRHATQSPAKLGGLVRGQKTRCGEIQSTSS